MTLDHVTNPVLADSVRSEKLDAPAGANVLRVEPVIDPADFERHIWIVLAFVVYWPDSGEWAGSGMVRTGGKISPAYTAYAARSLEGAKVIARAYAIDGAIKLGVRMTCGTRDDMPAGLEVPKFDTKGK